MEMLRWMSGYTLRDRIRYKEIRKGFRVAKIKDKMKDKRLKMVWACIKTGYQRTDMENKKLELEKRAWKTEDELEDKSGK